VQNSIKYIYDYFSNDLLQVDQTIKLSISTRDNIIKLISDYLLEAGGKRLRPILTIMSAKLFDYNGNNHIKIAAAVEFIHSATLLHDDVVDESNLRRGNLTTHQKWGNKLSILVGDFLFSQAFMMMVNTNSLPVLEVLSRAAGIIAEGEVMQLNVINNIELSKEQYIKIISAKTAELFAAACKAGAIIAEQTEETSQLMYELGANIGIAFQIIDDILDYSANIKKLGKNIGDDFYEGKVTLPAIVTYEKATNEEKEQIIKIFNLPQRTKEDFNLFRHLMSKYKTDAIVTNLASEFSNNCHQILDKLPDNKVRNMFRETLDYQIKRVS
jgi:octaprenyl-diphosphate synthase